MNAALFAFTERGIATAGRIGQCLSQNGDTWALYVPPRLAGEGRTAYEGGLPGFTGTVFGRDALIFVGACGIAVRAIAPHVASKLSDPAVLCVDERGGHVIPILSGHIGGANRLSWRVARWLDAEAVITTATDVNGRFSVDAWAAEHDLHISSMPLAKRVSAEILTRDIPFDTDAPEGRPAALAPGLVWGASGELGVCVSPRDRHPFDETLLLIPRALRVGIGCRRGIDPEVVAGAVRAVFRDNGLRPEAVREAASIDLKRDEAGLLAFCRRAGWPIRFYSSEVLNAVEGAFAASEFVRKTVGVDNVCERAALAEGGTLLVGKTARDGVTVAVAEMKWGIDFVQNQSGGHRPRSL